MYNGVHTSTWSIMSTEHDADKNNVKVKSYSYGEFNCNGLAYFNYFRLGAYGPSIRPTLVLISYIHT